MHYYGFLYNQHIQHKRNDKVARLPIAGSDSGVWGDILNGYLLQAHKQDGTLKDGSVGETQLAEPVQTKLNNPPNALLLSGDQTVDGDKTFQDVVRAKVFVLDNTVDSTMNSRLILGGGPYPGIAIDGGPGTQPSVQFASDPSVGSMVLRYVGPTGGSFSVFSSFTATTSAFSIDQNELATFSGAVTAPALKLTGGSPAAGKILTSDSAGNATWQPPLAQQATATLGSLFDPIIGTFPVSEIVQDSYDNDNLDTSNYGGITGTLWNSNRINTQAMKLVANNSTNPAAGCTNMPNGRTVGSCFDFEFEFTGDKLALMFAAFGYFDTQIYVENQGQMTRLKAFPMAGNHNGIVFRNIRFASYETRRIRVLAPYIYFYQIVHEPNAIVNRTPDRPMIAITGDSYVDGSTAYNSGSAQTYSVGGTVDAILEATGFAVIRLGQGGTGYFNNATGNASDAMGPNNSSRFFSASRLAAIQAFGTGKIAALIVNGTINDGELSGGMAGMKARALEGYGALNAWDPAISIVAVTPEPLNNPTAGNVHDLNRQGLIQAISSHPQGIGYIDVYNPDQPLWTGTGTEAAQGADPQTKLIGHDGVHPNWAGYRLYGGHIAANIAHMKLYSE